MCWVHRESLCAGCTRAGQFAGCGEQPSLMGDVPIKREQWETCFPIAERKELRRRQLGWGEAFACVPTFRVRCLRYGPTGASTTLYGAIQSSACCHTPLLQCHMPQRVLLRVLQPRTCPCSRRHVLRIVLNLYVILTSRSAFQKHLYPAIQGIILHPIFEGDNYEAINTIQKIKN